MPKNILIYSDGTGMAGGIRFESRGVRPSFCVATILRPNVHFGSKADIAERETNGMSALCPKADQMRSKKNAIRSLRGASE